MKPIPKNSSKLWKSNNVTVFTCEKEHNTQYNQIWIDAGIYCCFRKNCNNERCEESAKMIEARGGISIVWR